MPKLECKCGHVFNLSKAIAEDYLLVPDTIVAKFVVADRLAPADVVEALDEASRKVLLCPTCRRIWLQEGRGSMMYEEYVPHAAVPPVVGD